MKKPEIMDTTLRDGEQTPGVSFPPNEKYDIAQKLFSIGVDRIEVASALAVEYEKEAVRRICEMAQEMGRLNDVEVLGFVNEKSIDWIYEAGARTVNLLTKGSERHCRVQLKKTTQEHIEDIARVVQYAHSKGMVVNAYLEDGSNGMVDSKEEHLFPMIENFNVLGVKRVMFADTLGVLYPLKTKEYVEELKKSFPGTHFDFHAHNDYGLATANTLFAIEAGIDGIHVTLNRLGERTGNCSLYEIVAGARDHLGIDFKVDEAAFYELSRIVEMYSKIRLGENTPIVGQRVHEQTSGIHADGDDKGSLYKSLLTAERFGKAETTYALGKQGGLQNTVQNLKVLGIEEEDKEVLRELTDTIRRIGSQKKALTREDLWLLYQDLKEGAREKLFEVLSFESSTKYVSGTEEASEASCSFKARLKGKIYEVTARGDGGFDAFMNGLKDIFSQEGIELPKLADYEPRIARGGGSDAIVESRILWEIEGSRLFATIGVDTDQLVANMKAVGKMANLVLRGYR